jgi:hypothetical protein
MKTQNLEMKLQYLRSKYNTIDTIGHGLLIYAASTFALFPIGFVIGEGVASVTGVNRYEKSARQAKSDLYDEKKREEAAIEAGLAYKSNTEMYNAVYEQALQNSKAESQTLGYKLYTANTLFWGLQMPASTLLFSLYGVYAGRKQEKISTEIAKLQAENTNETA